MRKTRNRFGQVIGEMTFSPIVGGQLWRNKCLCMKLDVMKFVLTMIIILLCQLDVACVHTEDSIKRVGNDTRQLNGRACRDIPQHLSSKLLLLRDISYTLFHNLISTNAKLLHRSYNYPFYGGRHMLHKYSLLANYGDISHILII
ncbi:hypothetical protein RIR_jg5081.t1 [Rhizophagus irregularis DAOM 181602=DAOM 197198]|uniref:Uncharacterized protein n=1 Tax=Rhizophagus irregularis (strain DAOM 181602 / DAOM 197198 / MUCL 43194) TaxID=747089 RepID=U9UIV0_RHIID|nr:hypothetical protein RIR_jg5081.t1 [Rhizophagus irregularis DAOM 181602=DAOM 197198]